MNETNDNDKNNNPSGGFRPIGTREPTPLFRQRPGEDEDYDVFEGDDGFACFVRSDVLRVMRRWAREHHGAEKIGRLGGRWCEDPHGDYVLVERATLNRHADSHTAGVVANNQAQAAALAEFERACRPLCCVGWWHSHPPGCGAFYSSVDCDNQRTWNHANAIGIVIDPESPRRGLKVYRGPESVELVPEHHTFAPVEFDVSPVAGQPNFALETEGAPHNWATVALIVAVLFSIAAMTMSVLTSDLVFQTLQSQATTIPSDGPSALNLRQTTLRGTMPGDARPKDWEEPPHETEVAVTVEPLNSDPPRKDK